MQRLEDLGQQQDYVGRFYVALHDEQLRDLEELLAETDEAARLYQPVLDLYNRWKNEKTGAREVG